MDALVTTFDYISQFVPPCGDYNATIPIAHHVMPAAITFFNVFLLAWSGFFGSVRARLASLDEADRCEGYRTSNVIRGENALTADLTLVGRGCGIYGADLKELRVGVQWESDSRLHVMIYDKDEQIYQVPEFVVPRPTGSVSSNASLLDISIEEEPFSFAVIRKSNGEEIFNTKGSNLVFETQYWRLRTSLPENPSLYGLGEHTDSLRLPTSDYVRTMWARDAGAVPENTNLYGTHPVYYEHRLDSGYSHGVLLMNSNGMDIKIDDDDGQYLEYNVLGGVMDFYFMAGPSPMDVAREYSEITQKAAMMPYWGLGFHQCRFGYESVEEVAEVVANYSKANIPLETMWTDIDYMDKFKVFTLGETFKLEDMRAFIDKLHANDQHYIVMVDPAVAAQNYSAYNNGLDADIFLKNADGSVYTGEVWPGVTAFPDWFHSNVQSYWDNEFAKFFDAETGIDIDALWIDMNEPSNFREYPPEMTEAKSIGVGQAGTRSSNTKEAVPHALAPQLRSRKAAPKPQARRSAPRQAVGTKKGLPGRDLMNPLYKIRNDVGSLSNRTADTDLIHQGGWAEYDTHNLYGTMMSEASRKSMLKRRPNKRPMVITRSTFVGAGSYVGHWLGDNVSSWEQYLTSIRHLLQFVSFFQVPMAGADVCGFLEEANEHLCARWTVLGAFYPFYRNHNVNDQPPQEAYRWESVAAAARKAIDIRYRLLDYIYTAMHKQTVDGTPMLAPLWMHYPADPQTLAIQTQFFYGPSLLINPVTEESSTAVSFYLPSDTWYDFFTHKPVRGAGTMITYTNVTDSDIPILIRGGSIIPLRAKSAMTTKALRDQDFELYIAPDDNGFAEGTLYLDDGESLVQESESEIVFRWDGEMLKTKGTFGFETGVRIRRVTVLGDEPKSFEMDGGLAGPWDIRLRI